MSGWRRSRRPLSSTMEELTQDLHHALDEATQDEHAASNNDRDDDGDDETNNMGHGIVDRPVKDHTTHARRKSWRRRCKSTSNLSSLAALASNCNDVGESNNYSSTDSTGAAKQNASCSKSGLAKRVETKKASFSSSESDLADDKETTNSCFTKTICKNDNDSKALLLSAAVKTAPGPATGAVRRKKTPVSAGSRELAVPGKRSYPLDTPGSSKLLCSSDAALPPPKLRAGSVSVKRKRKFKRMAVDPMMSQATSDDTNSVLDFNRQSNGQKRSKMIRPRFLSATASSGLSSSVSGNPVPFFVGKRKRSGREKTLTETCNGDLSKRVTSSLSLASRCCPSSSKLRRANNIADNDQDNNAPMELEEEENGDDASSSSISSSEWEAEELDDNIVKDNLDPGREADDEQSDWPGPENVVHPLNASAVARASDNVNANSSHDDWDDDDQMATESKLSTLFSNLVRTSEDSLTPLTSTARQAYMARMRQLADCVPGREIRAGSRRLPNRRQEGFTIRSSSSEQLARFLHDPSRSELRLNVLRASDRDQIEHLAKLYALSVRRPQQSYEGAAPTLVLSKTAKTLYLKELAVHQPSVGLADFKRRRRTPPNSPLFDTSSNDVPAVQMGNTASQLQNLLLKERARDRQEANSDHGGLALGHKNASAAGSAST